MAKEIYTRKSTVGGFKEKVSSNANSFYFERGAVKMFGSKVQSVYKDDKNHKYVAYETLSNAPDGRLKAKILYYNDSDRKFKTSDIYQNPNEAKQDFKDIIKGEKDVKEVLR